MQIELRSYYEKQIGLAHLSVSICILSVYLHFISTREKSSLACRAHTNLGILEHQYFPLDTSIPELQYPGSRISNLEPSATSATQYWWRKVLKDMRKFLSLKLGGTGGAGF